MTRDDIVKVAQEWIGTPYQHQGRNKGFAIDCIGLVWGVWHDLGLPPRDIPEDYGRSPVGNMLQLGCDEHLVKCPDMKLLKGRVAIMWGDTRNVAQHFAIVGTLNGFPSMIHAFSKHERVIEHGFHSFWMQRLMGLYEFPGVED